MMTSYKLCQFVLQNCFSPCTLYIHVTYLVFTYTVANNFSDQLLVYNFIQLAPTYAIMEDLVDQMVCVDVLWTGQDQTAVKVSVKLHMSVHMATLHQACKNQYYPHITGAWRGGFPGVSGNPLKFLANENLKKSKIL